MRPHLLAILPCSLALCTAMAEVRMSADTPEKHIDCQTEGQVDVIGALLEVARDSFVLNLCSPAADCPIIHARFAVEAPGIQDLDRYLKTPAYVHVTAVVERKHGTCVQFMSVANVASWAGAPDPAGRGNRPYFAVADHKTKVDGTWLTAQACVFGRGTLELRVGRTKLTLRLNAIPEISSKDALRWSARLLTAGACACQQGWSYWIAAVPKSD
jgi:hypothetical protein